MLCIVLAGALADWACQSAPPGEFSGDASWRYLLRQCEFGPRPPSTAAHDSTVAFIIDRLRQNGARVTLQRFEIQDPYGSTPLKLVNIIGSFAPEAEKRILLGAHFDTRPWADEDGDVASRGRPTLGANDGASGVAVLLELGDLLQRQLPRGLGVDLVFFDGEDYGKAGDLQFYLLGSKYFAARLGGYRPQCAVILDMVGARGLRIAQERNSLDYAPELTREIFARAERLNLDAFTREPFQHIYDDHVPLLQAGIPSVDLIGLPYAYWHTLEDTPDKCSKESLRQVGTLITDFVYDFSL